MVYRSISPDGVEIWRNKDYELHRDNNQPALVDPVGFRFWYVNGILHRTNGPALISSSRRFIASYWYVNGRTITAEVESWLKSKRMYSKMKRNDYTLVGEDILFEFKLRFL